MADKFQLKALITGVDKLSPMLKGVQKNAQSLRKNLEKSGLGKMDMGDIVGGGAFAAPFVMGVKAAMGFESKMADVKKVVAFDTPAQFQQMSKDVLGLSRELPMAASGIAEIVAAGGQAGIPRAELKGFATDAVKMGVAFDQTADESGKMMATWRTAFKMGQKDVVELADKINYLGNTGPANAKQISAIVTKIGPLGEVAGLANGQIAAMGATLAGVGVQEEVAATGMKNFMLALTAGSSATKAQSATFKALRLDAKQVAVGMQKDAQGTIMRVLTAVSKVDKTKQAAVLSQLFGRESIGAIAPMLTNLQLLEGNFKKVGDATAYAGSMEKEYAARAATTENNLQLLANRTVEVGIAMGNALLPPFNDFMDVIGPVVTGVADLAAANPWLVKGVLGAAVGFTVLRLGVLAATVAMKVFAAATALTPLGIAVRAIALLAGVVIANWGALAPFFSNLWGRLGIVAKFAWEMLKGIFSWTPLGLVIQHWEPIVAWFKQMWERIRPYVEPALAAGKWIGAKVGGLVSPGAAAPAAAAQPDVATNAQRTGWVANDRSLAGTRQSLVPQAAQAQKAQVNGEMVVRFENAPPGMQAETGKTDTPGLEMTPFVGYRSLSRRRTQ